MAKVTYKGQQFDSVEALTKHLEDANAKLAAERDAALAKAAPSLPTNCDMRMDGTTLVIRMDLSETHGASSSGKTTTVASTHGNRKFTTPDGAEVFVGVNAYRKGLVGTAAKA